VGVPAITTRGLKESEMERIVEMIDHVLMNPDDQALLDDTGRNVKEWMSEFPLYPELG
jgi:glycine hydroxymethyltransferase